MKAFLASVVATVVIAAVAAWVFESFDRGIAEVQQVPAAVRL